MSILESTNEFIEFLNNAPPWIPTVIAISGGLFGLIGTTLGIANFYMNVSERRTYIKVNPFIAFQCGKDGFLSVHNHSKERLKSILDQGGCPIPAMQVINLSKFPIVIDEVGFCYSSPKKRQRCPFIKPIVIPNSILPARLESRESLSIYGEAEHMDAIHKGMRTAYITTSCNTEKTVKSRHFTNNFKYIKNY